MKSVIVILLLGLYAYSAIMPPVIKAEVGKLPALMKHYAEHRVDNPELSLYGFLKLHYGASFAKHAHEHNHDQLPGKEMPGHTHAVACGCQVLALLMNSEWHLNPYMIKSPAPVPGEDRPVSSLLAQGIWQPPRLA